MIPRPVLVLAFFAVVGWILFDGWPPFESDGGAGYDRVIEGQNDYGPATTAGGEDKI